MMCHRIGLPPVSIMGLGRRSVSALIRVPIPPASRTTFMVWLRERVHPPASGRLETQARLQHPDAVLVLGPDARIVAAFAGEPVQLEFDGLQNRLFPVLHRLGLEDHLAGLEL